MADSYTFRDEQRIKVTLTDGDTAAAVDPSVVSFSFKNSGGTTTYVYGTDAELVRDSAGVYYVKLNFTVAGNWYWTFWGTDPGFAEEGRLSVQASNI